LGKEIMVDSTLRIASWLQPQGLLLDVDIRDREHALEVSAAEIGRAHGVDPGPIFRALWRREQSGSTALGDGFAIPHARTGGLVRPLTLFLRARHPLAFHAPDGKPVTDLLVIMVPADGANDDHLQLLALVAQLFSDSGFRKQLHRAPDVAAAEKAFQEGITLLLHPAKKDATS
jgi:PTS system nitrogen regulatory IIA component